MTNREEQQALAIANAVRLILLPYVGMLHAKLVEAMDLRPAVLQGLTNHVRDLRSTSKVAS